MWKTAIALVPRREDDPPATRRPHPQRTLCGQRSQGRRSVHRPAARAAITSMRGGCRRLMWRLEAYAARNSDPAALAGGGAYIFIRPFSHQRLSVLLCCASAWVCFKFLDHKPVVRGWMKVNRSTRCALPIRTTYPLTTNRTPTRVGSWVAARACKTSQPNGAAPGHTAALAR